MYKLILTLSALVALTFSCKTGNKQQAEEQKDTTATVVTEKHLANIKRLTWGGDNAEAYFSFNSNMLTFQRTFKKMGITCDQIFLLRLDEPVDSTTEFTRLSTGDGRTTCSYFMAGDSTIVYASTHKGSKACPPEPGHAPGGKYLWAIYPDFDIYVADLKGNIKKQLTSTPGYDAEATVSPDGSKIVFTSMRDGDLDLYVMDADGKNVKRITNGLGYDGGAFFSPDGKRLVFRASRPQTEEEQKEYKELLKQNLVAPTNMEIYTCNIDGSDLKQITKLGKANWAPFFHPSGNKIIFSSNHRSEGRGYNFQLYIMNDDGTEVEAVTQESKFNAFPMFSPDGKKLVFSSNRNAPEGSHSENTDLYVADWVE